MGDSSTATSVSERTPLLSNDASTRRDRSPSPTDSARSSHLTTASTTTVKPTPSRDSREQDATIDTATEPSLLTKFIKFSLLWGTISAVVLFCIVQSIRKGHGEFDWKTALKKAGGGGLAGALSMVLQVLLLMPLRTTMNYQYAHGGTSFSHSFNVLKRQGGYSRFYAGLVPALVQGPVARFGDTASNAGVLALLASNEWLKDLPTAIKTALASLLGALFRMVLTPVDTLKTTMQTESNARALVVLRDRIRNDGPGTLWNGAWATAAANFVGSFPWFATYNYLSQNLPMPSEDPTLHSRVALTLLKLSRQALIGFVSSVVSDTISNSLRVIKTYRQTSDRNVGYRQATREILAKEGPKGLFGRGLKTRLLANGLQGILFSVLWKVFQELIEGRKDPGNKLVGSPSSSPVRSLYRTGLEP
ncbi:uncharacterized protein JCM15063_002266 [Sporobolomyces koalae]|uniref:uncharacterized protein n=1 Tax=Sporobolomyces koalae TaxID=500713 RepID=UPI00316CFCAD